MSSDSTLRAESESVSSLNHAALRLELLNEEQLSRLRSNIRYDGIFLIIASLISIVFFWGKINLIHFFVLFFIIDVIGYYPSLVLSAIRTDNVQPKAIYWLYNFFHSNSGGLTIGAMYVFFGGHPANILALSLHYGIDRGILGNYIKNYGEHI